jgi:hypothetical protein
MKGETDDDLADRMTVFDVARDETAEMTPPTIKDDANVALNSD